MNSGGGTSPDIVIVGGGIGGLIVGRELKRRGYTDFVIAEKTDAIGGVWRDNHYPNCACDAPIDIYCVSFHPSAEFSSNFAPAHEILAYVREIAEVYGLNEHVRLSTKITAARWMETEQRWEVTTARGERWTPRFFIWSGGRLHRPLIPDFPGRADFRGEVFHTAQYRDDVEIEGRNVALVGAGASAIQVSPYLAQRAKRYYALFRTPAHVMPKDEIIYTEELRKARREDPSLIAASRLELDDVLDELARTRFPMNMELINKAEAKWREYFESVVKDPKVREALDPGYRIGCRRYSFSNEFYQTLVQPHVTVARTTMESFTPTGVRVADGREFEVDVVVLATGFKADRMLGDLRIEGRDGADLAERWREVQEAYLGVAVKSFPNLFLVEGPNAEQAAATMTMELHANYIGSCIEFMENHGKSTIEVRPEAQAAFNVEVVEKTNNSVLVLGGCHSWHRVGGTGRVFTHWPGTPRDMRRRVAKPDFDHFVFGGHDAPVSIGPSKKAARAI